MNNLIFAITSTVSLALLIIGLLPWAKKRRARALIPGLVLFLSGLPFFVEIVLIPAVFGLCAIILFLSRYGPVAVDQRRPVGILGYILLGLTFLITPVLTVFSIILVEETRADEVLLLITPAWLLFSGIILKIAGSGKKNLAPIKPLLFTGELSVLFSFPLFAFLAVAENSRGDKEMFYAIALGSSVIFSLCVLFRGLLGNWLCGLLFGKPEPKISMVDKENTGLPPLIATPVRKPAMFLSNYGGVVVMGGLAVLGLFGFVIGLFFDSLVDAYKASPVPVGIEPSFEGGWNGMLTAIWAPFALVLSPLSLFGGIYVLCWAIQHTRRYWYGWVGLILLALASPFLLVLGHTITESIFAKPDAVALVAQEEEEEIEEQWPAGVDRDDDGFDDYDEFLTGHDPQDPNDTPKLMEVEEAISEFHWEDSDEDGFDDYDEHIVGTDPTNSEDTPTQEQVDAALAERETVLAKEEADAAEEQREAQAKALEPLPGHDPSNLQGNYGIKKIHLAVLRGDLADTQAQVSTNADINAPDEVGNTPLHLALGLSETMIAEWLISQGADLQAKTNDGRAVVHAAAAGGQLELLKKLVAEGLKLDTKNALGQGPLHLACAAGQTETIEWLFGQGQTATAPDANGNTPLHMAVIHGRVGLVKPLIDAGADLKQLNTLGEAAIHLACTNGQVGLVNWMLEQDATLANLPDGDRFTPLYHAAINGNSRTVSLLLTHKAEIKAGDNAELGELFAKVLADNVEYFERFEEQMNPFGGMGMGMMGMMPFGMGMPGMGMNPYGMMGMGGMGMPEFDEEEFEGIGIDSDEDGFDDYDENLVGTDPEDSNDTPTQEQVDTAQAEKDAAEIAEDDAANLLVEDESSDESEMDPEEEEEAMRDFGGLPGMPPGMMPGLNPYGMGNPFGMPGMQGEAKKDAPKPKERQALMGIDANGNTVMHLVAAIGSSEMVEAATNIPELSREDTNQLGFTPPDLVKALGREEVAPHLADYEDAYGGMGGMYGMGMMGMMPGMMPFGMMGPGMGGMGMGGMGMREDESEKTNLFPPLKKPVDLWFTESDRIDSDEDGFDDHDENLTGHNPENPNDTPTQKEVDAAETAEKKEMSNLGYGMMPYGMGMGMPGMMPYGMMGPGGMGMNPYGMMGMEMEADPVEVQVKDELKLRSVAQKRIPTGGQPRSFFEQVIANKGELCERQKINGLFHQATDPQTGYSAIKWMELLNRNQGVTHLANVNPKDAALERHLARQTDRAFNMPNVEPQLHRLAREGNVYELSFALSRDPNPNLRDGRGRTALHVAAASGRVSLMKQLLSLGADPAAVDQYGFTALHWAAQDGQLESARHLVEEVKVERVADQFSRTPADLAKSRGHTTVSDYLSAN
ncbi:MAG: ankyrin repeat domain-containing protein [Verrucomicrobiota bacterium]|nr:ankyrin repeat domain-containing protein [Verrucomicrobiota bacterium]